MISHINYPGLRPPIGCAFSSSLGIVNFTRMAWRPVSHINYPGLRPPLLIFRRGIGFVRHQGAAKVINNTQRPISKTQFPQQPIANS